MLVFIRPWALVFASLWLVSLASPAYADPALDWVSTVETATTKLPGARGDRARAIAWLAAFNALNTIEPRYRPYAPAPAATESDATAPAPMATLASALYTALAVEPEADQALLLRSYRDTLAAIKAAPEREAGVALGSRAAVLLLNARAGDRLARVEAGAREPAPGVFVRPAYAKMGSSTTLAGLAPFGVRSVAAFDPGPPPALGSEAAAREIAEVRAIGAIGSTTRSADQTAAALFWNSGDPGDYSMAVKATLEARKLDPLDTARIAALDAMISIDTNIASVLFKDRYHHWRPETAIAGPHAAAAHREADWQTLVRTPNSPDHPSGGGTFAGMIEVTLPRLVGMTGIVEWRNTQTGQTRRWPDAAAMASEIASARVWAGVHFRSAVEAGRKIGRGVATEVLDRQLLPR